MSIGAVIGYKNLRHESLELFDAQLARSAQLILGMVQLDHNINHLNSIDLLINGFEQQLELNESDDKEGLQYQTSLGFQLWDSAGNLILKSPNVPIAPITKNREGYSYRHFNHADWRVFSLTSENKKFRCIVSERLDIRNYLIREISTDFILVFIFLIPALLITLWFSINQGLLPLHRLAQQIQRRGAEKLDAVSDKNTPSEIKTITLALNRLFSRLKDALAREKRITSDAAHELRTPLAAVRLHAELAQTATSKQDRIDSINHVILGIDRTTHLVDQILALARLEPDSLNTRFDSLDLTRRVQQEMSLLQPMAHQKGIQMKLNGSLSCNILADNTALGLLFRNLLSNAIIYTPDGGRVDVSILTRQQKACIIIEDSGPGIPAAERELVLQRFYRMQNHDKPGCGIGLSIVMRVIELLDGEIKFEDSHYPTGLKVTVCFSLQVSSPN